MLGLKITAEAQNTDEETINVLGEMLPSNDKRVNTKIQLIQQKNHYIGKLLKELKNVIPMRRLGSYSEILGILFFLSNNDSSYITGQNILVDGGRTVI